MATIIITKEAVKALAAVAISFFTYKTVQFIVMDNMDARRHEKEKTNYSQKFTDNNLNNRNVNTNNNS